MERSRRFRCRQPFRRRQYSPTLRTFCKPPRGRSRKIARLCREADRFVLAPAGGRACVAARVRLSRRPGAGALPASKFRDKNRATAHRKVSMFGPCAKEGLIREGDRIKTRCSCRRLWRQNLATADGDIGSYNLINICLGGIARVAANGTQARAAAAFRFRTVNPLERYSDQKRDRSQSADRH